MWERRPTRGSARPRGTDALTEPQSGKRALALRLGNGSCDTSPSLFPMRPWMSLPQTSPGSLGRMAWSFVPARARPALGLGPHPFAISR